MPFFPRSPLSRSERPGRRQDNAGEVSLLSFDVESFEFIPAGEEMGLLRVVGQWVAPVDRDLHEIRLIASQDGTLVELTPLPDLEGASPLATPVGHPWRAAFSAGSELVESELTEFALAVHGGERVHLPRPGEDAAEAEAADVAPSPVEEAPVGAASRNGDELLQLRSELEKVRTELEVERRRHAALEEEIRSRTTLENDLRSAMAMHEAELAAAVARAAQSARREDRQRERVASVEPGGADHPQHPVHADLHERLARARRAADAAA